MNVLVTGATGYLGQVLVPILRNAGHNVIPCGSQDRYKWMESVASHNVDVVVHLAWYASAGNASPAIQQQCLDNTHTLMRRIVQVSPVPRMVFTSTLSIYGENGVTVSRESDWVSPQCHYTRAKAAAEWSVQCHMNPENITILRLGSLMGIGVRRTKRDLVVNAFSIDGYRTGKIEVWSPESAKPVLHVQDAAEVVASACTCDGWQGTWNIHNGQDLTSGQIAGIASRITGAEVVTVGDPNGAARRSVRASVEKLRARTSPGGLLRFRTVEETVPEFEHYVPSDRDRTVPWS